MRHVAVAIGLFGVLAGCGGKDDVGPPVMLPKCTNPVMGTTVTTHEVGRVTGAALLATSPPADLRLFVLEQRGAIRIFANDMLLPAPFLDISNDIAAGGEQGLLGLAFHPDYAHNGLFFIDYTTSTHDVVARCSVSATDPNVANPTCTPILQIPDFASNHNGGIIEFGKDGFLYISTGDGGGGGDPNQNGQAITNGSPLPASIALLGKILRIDVDTKATGKEYGIPPGNPFATGGGEPEIFIIGLRNPWRWSFDRETGDMWIGDVGQGEIEELDVLRPAAQKGANLGWSMYEGAKCFRQPCDATGKLMPQDSRTHADGWISVIGGTTYRGTCYPDLVGWHFYTDYGHGGLFKARLNADDTVTIQEVPGTFPGSASSLHADARGEMFLTTTDGRVYHLEAGP
jgi:glucose/arabinose dehydrogenase